jgi:hypothetical protein
VKSVTHIAKVQLDGLKIEKRYPVLKALVWGSGVEDTSTFMPNIHTIYSGMHLSRKYTYVRAYIPSCAIYVIITNNVTRVDAHMGRCVHTRDEKLLYERKRYAKIPQSKL